MNQILQKYVGGLFRCELSGIQAYSVRLFLFAGTEKSNSPGVPVVVFVHGDSYEHGSGNSYDFSLFSSLGNVIAVTLNYRLGLLGKSSDYFVSYLADL